MRTCYIHVGAPKCGSTSIQKSLYSHREELPKLGLVYPGQLSPRHNFLITINHPDPMSLRFNWKAGKSKKDVAELVEDARESFEQDIRTHSSSDIIISNEVFLIQADNLDLQSLRKYLEQFCDRIVVVVLVRDPFSLMNSRAQEQIKSGVRTYEAVVKNPAIFDFQKIEYYREAFGAENVNVEKMESLLTRGDTLMSSFAKLIGCNEDAARSIPDIRANESLPLEAILLISELNKFTGMEVGEKRRKKGNARVERGLNLRHFRDIGRTKFSLPISSVQQKWDHLDAQYSYLKNRLGIDYPDPKLRDPKDDPQPDWDSETLAAIIKSANSLGVQNMKLRKELKALQDES